MIDVGHEATLAHKVRSSQANERPQPDLVILSLVKQTTCLSWIPGSYFLNYDELNGCA